jgi:hypothetical protein
MVTRKKASMISIGRWSSLASGSSGGSGGSSGWGSGSGSGSSGSGRATPLWIRFLPAAGASITVAYVGVAGDLDSIPRNIAIGTLIASWIAPLFFARREVGSHGTVVLAIAAVVAAGQTRIGPLYGVLAGIFLLACLASMRAARTKRLTILGGGGLTKSGLPVRALIALPLIALPITISLLIGLPWLAEKAQRRFSGMFGGDNTMATAFSTNMMLGATHGMFQSDAVVMRIEGLNAEARIRQVEYLRGAVYDDYDLLRWQTSFAGAERSITDADFDTRHIEADASAWRITLSRNAPRGNDMRWFLPANACDITTKEQRVEIDHFGVSRRAINDEVPQSMTFRVAGTACKEQPAALLPPTPRDLRLAYRNTEARKLAAQLTPIANAWVAKANATTKRAKLKAIERELATSYEYSLAVDRTPSVDPVIDFLTIHKAGHCEYFASAMVLLARTQGISARLVGGYHTTEVNPLTNQVVVRDRNAHTWVEAWIDDEEVGGSSASANTDPGSTITTTSTTASTAGAWYPYDPTPAVESLGRRSRFQQVTDLISSLIERAIITLRRLGPLGIAIVLASALAVYYAGRAVVRFVRTQLQIRRRRRSGRRLGDDDIPLPCFVSLESALKSAGHARDESEPIEAFARRLRASSLPWAKDVVRALQTYAELRYGNIGDETVVEKEMADARRAVARTSRHAKN